jgi:hypothetical protein
MSDLLKVIDDGEVLTEVIPLSHVDLPGELAAIWLYFSPTVLCIQVDPQDDSLKLVQSPPAGMTTLESLTTKEPWKRAIRKQVLWAWRLTNHQGYVDGIQLAFCEPGTGRESVVIQLIGKASTVETIVAHRV